MENKPELIYIGDPLCSWCWGVAPEVTLLKDQYTKEFDFKIILGGLRPGTSTVMSDKQKKFLREHWEEIGEISGQPFKYDILESNDFIYDTEPPARAVYCVRKINPMLEFDFFKAVQKVFYAESKNTNQIETYQPICEELFIEWATFEELFNAVDSKEKTEEDFDAARMLGVTGFPTLLLKINQKHRVITRGYNTYQNMVQKVQHWLNE